MHFWKSRCFRCSGIVGELELVTKDVCTDFQEPQPTKATPMQFTHITRECNVCTLIRLEGPQMFKAAFDMLKPKACAMTYRHGQKKSLQMWKRGSSVELSQPTSATTNSETWTSSKTITGARVVANSDETLTEFIKWWLDISILNF